MILKIIIENYYKIIEIIQNYIWKIVKLLFGENYCYYLRNWNEKAGVRLDTSERVGRFTVGRWNFH